jgi:hypothetical protein
MDLSPGVSTPEQIADRLAELRRKLTARTDRAGNALPRFRDNVADLQSEIERLEALDG